LTAGVKGVLRLAEYAGTALLILLSAFAVAEYATGTQPFYVVADSPSSMSPAINYGDVAVIYRTSFSNLGPGSVIAFHDPRGNPGIIVHGVVATLSCGGAKCLATKGENNATNPTTDPWNVTQSNYVGQVILVVPYVGYMSPALWGFNGIYALLPIATVVLVVLLVFVLRQGPKGDDKKEEHS
jgi:signal peptidase I